MTQLEKTVFLYESEPKKHAHVKDRTKRIQNVKEIKAKTDKTINDIHRTLGIQTTVDLLDLENQKPKREADGEFSSTRDLNNQQLMQKQREMVRDQN